MGKTHELKTWPEYFEAMKSLHKTFEYRLNDRDFQRGDVLRLREFDPDTNDYTNREFWCMVRYVLTAAPGLPDGYCIMSVGAPMEDM